MGIFLGCITGITGKQFKAIGLSGIWVFFFIYTGKKHIERAGKKTPFTIECLVDHQRFSGFGMFGRANNAIEIGDSGFVKCVPFEVLHNVPRREMSFLHT